MFGFGSEFGFLKQGPVFPPGKTRLTVLYLLCRIPGSSNLQKIAKEPVIDYFDVQD